MVLIFHNFTNPSSEQLAIVFFNESSQFDGENATDLILNVIKKEIKKQINRKFYEKYPLKSLKKI